MKIQIVAMTSKWFLVTKKYAKQLMIIHCTKQWSYKSTLKIHFYLTNVNLISEYLHYWLIIQILKKKKALSGDGSIRRGMQGLVPKNLQWIHLHMFIWLMMLFRNIAKTTESLNKEIKLVMNILINSWIKQKILVFINKYCHKLRKEWNRSSKQEVIN